MLKSLMVAKAKEELEQEILVKEEEKQKYLSERAPPLNTSGLSLAQLQDLCRELHEKVDVVDEERYDIEAKVTLNTRGNSRGPIFDAVRVSADAILRSLLGSKHKVSMDLRANLKSVKKEDTEKKRPVEDSDWRKNVEAMSGMEGRKKMFDAAKECQPVDSFLPVSEVSFGNFTFYSSNMSISRKNWSALSSLARQWTMEDEEEVEREKRRRVKSIGNADPDDDF
ncbi:Troponin I, slow skeletal muscle [Larimichthys crocea]|uniref:Uncharacterized protein n=1 Tax=Larimichthys crocea TaxID=215358 RepID=A0ACD3R8V2_LARCR|nr:Troponin I, slow skeletal muscle [Larimichthys crocea]